jgi:hypothetical protein
VYTRTAINQPLLLTFVPKYIKTFYIKWDDMYRTQSVCG